MDATNNRVSGPLDQSQGTGGEVRGGEGRGGEGRRGGGGQGRGGQGRAGEMHGGKKMTRNLRNNSQKLRIRF